MIYIGIGSIVIGLVLLAIMIGIYAIGLEKDWKFEYVLIGSLPFMILGAGALFGGIEATINGLL